MWNYCCCTTAVQPVLSTCSVCTVTHIARVWINRVRLPILLVVSWTGKMNIYFPVCVVCAWEIGLARRFRQSRPASACSFSTLRLNHQSGAYLRDSSRVPRRRPFIYFKPPYAIGSVPSLSGHAIAYRWHSLPTVRRQRASKPQGIIVPNECCLGRSPWTNKYTPLFPTPTIGMKWACWKYWHAITTSYQKWVWEREAHINWSMKTCQGSTRSELPWGFTGPVPADSRQWAPSIRICETR